MKQMEPEEFRRLLECAPSSPPSPTAGLVWRAADGTYLKLFRRKRGLTSALWHPPIRGFCRASLMLRERGIPTIAVVEAFRVRRLKRHIVRYRGVAGSTLRQLLGAPECTDHDRSDLLVRFARLLANLHERGIYFRGIHLDNVMVTPDGSLGLIDVADCRFFRTPLSPTRRARNFKPPLREQADRIAIERFGVEGFVGQYLDAANLDQHSRGVFLEALRGEWPLRRDAIDRLQSASKGAAT